MVLDRPNPIGGVAVQGSVLDPAFATFVGLFPIPMRHGLTIGEIALLFNNEYGIGCDLEVIPMDGWNREMFFKQMVAVFLEKTTKKGSKNSSLPPSTTHNQKRTSTPTCWRALI